MGADEPSIMACVSAAEYTIGFPPEYTEKIKSALKAVLDAEIYEYQKKTKSGVKKVNMRSLILSAYTDTGQITAVLSAGGSNLDPRAFIDELASTAGLVTIEPEIMRTELFYNNNDALVPLIKV